MSVLEDAGWEKPKIKILHQKGKFTISDNAETLITEGVKEGDGLVPNIFNYSFIFIDLIITYPNGTTKTKCSDLSRIGDKENGLYDTRRFRSTEYTFDFNQSGEYLLKFNFGIRRRDVIVWNDFYETVTTYIYVNPENSELKPYTLGDTIRRLLNVTPLRRKGELNKYTFDNVQLAEFDKEESPEFAFTGHTLFEALLIIAQYKGSFPVLKDGVISFRKLWNGVRLKESDLPNPIDEISCSDINQYCTYLESEVQNLVGVNDSQAGSVIEPYAGGYKTTRAASGSVISQDTAVIPTNYNIYQHIKQEVGYIGDTLPENNDISEYVYESGDYYALTDKSAVYPASKAYALQWAQMGQNVTELAHRIKTVNDIVNAFTYPAIANIIQAKTGISYNTGVVGYIQNLIDEIKNDKHTLGKNSFADLMFRTTYIPIINSRIKQYKDYYGDFHFDGSLKYNQTAELVDSELYGEHLKQLIRKLGNKTKRKIYIFDTIDEVPKVGTLVGNYSVYDVQMSIRENKVIATISYVKYAELSQYIGVKNPWKDSDVSTDKCYNRQISFNEFLLFTHDENKECTSESLTQTGLKFLLPGSHSDLFNSIPLTCVEGTGFTKEGEKLNTCLLPVVSLAIGNSIMFQWQYQNNYSAGYMSEQAPEGATSVLSGTRYNRAQKTVKYADMYGKLETYNFNLMHNGPTIDENLIWIEGAEEEWKPHEVSYPGDVTFEIKNTLQVNVKLSEPYPFKVTVKFLVQNEKEQEKEYEVTINANMTHNYKSISNLIPPLKTVTLISATCFDTNGYTFYTAKADIAKMIGYNLPLKPSQLRIVPDFSEWESANFISVKNLLVQKNSSEALTFAVQYHYCTQDENFIIGSGLTNFCPLIGGSAEELVLYGFKERINIFNRRIAITEDDKKLDFTSDNIKSVDGKVHITLPPEINEYQAWAYLGKDKNGNYQIIFGENKDLEGSDFKTELYLLPVQNMEDIL